jgi:hypothetical protein
MWQSGGMALMRPPYSLAPMRDRIMTFFAAAQNVRFWHKADITTRSANVRFWG